MDLVLDVDRCHGGESGTGRGGDFPNAARLNEVVPELIVDGASPTPTGLLEILAKSFVVRQRISRPNQEQLYDWIEINGKRKQNCLEMYINHCSRLEKRS